MNHKLFDLIKSLSKNEKGYYKKYASFYSTEDNIYFKLFDKIEKQKVFNEEVIKKELFSKYSKTNYYNVVKNYLFESLLKSLRSFHSQKKISYKVNALFINVEIMYHKKLISQCTSELRKVKKIMYENELFERHSELFIWEIRLLALKGFSPKYDKAEQKIYKEIEAIKTKISNIEVYSMLQYKVYSLTIQTGTRRTKAVIEKLEKLVATDFFKDDNKPLTKKAYLKFYNTKCKYYEFIGDKEKFYIYSEKFVEILDSNEFLIKDNIDNLIYGYYNLLLSCANLKNDTQFHLYFKKFNNIPKKYSKYCTKEVKNLIAFYALNVLLNFLIVTEDFESASELDIISLPLKEKEMKGVFKLIYIELLYYTSYVSFVLGKNKKTQDQLNRILENPSAIFRKDILTYTKLLDLLNHYELGNYVLVSNLIETISNSFSKNKTKYKFDKYILKMLNKLLNAKNSKQKTLVFKNYLEQFTKLYDSGLEINSFEHLNIIRWIKQSLNKNNLD